jgi:hypothetical protein
MKMKAIFLLLNAVLGVAFLVIFLTPLFLVGGDWFHVFWTRNWPIAIIFVLTMGIVDAYFIMNWKLFSGLERENWGEVAGFLEQRIFKRGWITSPRVRLLLNTYLVTSNTQGILALEAYLAEKRPGLIPRFSLPFGIPHLLANEPTDAEAWFRGMLGQPRLAERDWVSWNHAFTLLQARKSDEARTELAGLIERVSEPVLMLLTVYLLDVLARSDAALESQVAAKREILKARHTPETIRKAIEKSSANIQVVVLARLLQDASHWLFAPSSSPGQAEA